MFCKKCGNILPENATYCSSCGNVISNNETNAYNSTFTGIAAEQYKFRREIATQSVQTTSMYYNNNTENSNSFNPTITPKKSKSPIIIGLISILVCIGLIFGATILVKKVDEKSSSNVEVNSEFVKAGYITDKTELEPAFNELLDTYISAIYANEYEIFEACLFPGDFNEDRHQYKDYSNKQYMSLLAPVYPSYDNFNSWTVSNLKTNMYDNPEDITTIQENYKFINDWTFDKYCDITFDLTLKSDTRCVTIPCNVEMVFAKGHWYFWYTYFDTFNYYHDTYSYTGDGIDTFVRDYVLDEESKDKDN